jgi:hypothetical protein
MIISAEYVRDLEHRSHDVMACIAFRIRSNLQAPILAEEAIT